MRIAGEHELPLVLKLCHAVYSRSPYSVLEWDEQKAYEVAKVLIQDQGIILLSGQTGILAAMVLVPHFSKTPITTELAWGSILTGREKVIEETSLHSAYEYWAKNVIRVPVLQTSTFGSGRWFEKRGLVPAEKTYLKVL